MSFINNILNNLPEVSGPLQRKLSFKEKLKWTLIILVAFFALSVIPLYGLGPNALEQFQFLSVILGASFGSIMSLGIGPIVTSSIVLQLLTGSGILKLDLTTHDGKRFFQGLQKILSIFFILFESMIYVFMGGLSPAAGFSPWLLIFQLALGGLIVLYMDEIINKWGFGSGISLFIAANVSAEVVLRAISPLTTAGTWAFGSNALGAPVGKFWVLITSLINRNPTAAGLALATILATVLVFLFSVYAQSMKIDIPLSFGRVRGYGIRWPLRFMYTSNIPVILTAALMANMQLWARLLERWGHPILGTFSGQSPVSGLVLWISSPNLIENLLTGSLTGLDIARSIVYISFMVIGAVVFSIFWVQTSGMDARSQANQIMASGLQIPGFRRDPRVLETILSRYISPLTIMGAIAVGVLAASADLMGALSSGTGLLLTVMIVYKLYEDIAQHHMMDMHPALRKMMGK